MASILSKLKPKATQAEHTENSASVPTSGSASMAEKNAQYDDSKVPYLTWRSFVMGIVASMGGFIFGYSTGQISGFETMNNFKELFAQHNASGYYFSNVRSGLIVGLVGYCLLHIFVITNTYDSLDVHWYNDRRSRRQPHRRPLRKKTVHHLLVPYPRRRHHRADFRHQQVVPGCRGPSRCRSRCRCSV
jgi:Sugar (and other) transporter